ncbi:HET-domain-containing protein, partial [Ophiobolus disseminans]
EQRNFRLLKLQSGDWNEPLQCRLLVENLNSLSYTYEAVSYVWGDATKFEPILCNGAHANITRSLFEALRVFRRSSGEPLRMLWADAICIDQANVRERSYQVQLMQQIYKAASKVLIWIG